jgi:predicted nucleotidyltransferase
MNEDAKAATEETRALPEEAIRDRIIRLAFGGDAERFETFVQALREVLPPDVSVVLRGSVVTGRRWKDGQPFDADGPGTSDLDLTLVGGEMLKLFEQFYIPGLHTVPLSDEHPDASPTFVPLRRALCTIAGRPVNIQATSSLVQYARDVLLDQPYFTLIDAEERREERSGANEAGRRP